MARQSLRTGRVPTWAALSVAALLLSAALPTPARAHMPLARAVAIAADGQHLALRLPGFGFVVGSPEAGYRYACDALLDVTRKALPGEANLGFAFRADGALWLGTRSGLRLLDAGGCPAADFDSDLAAVPIAALAADPAGAQLYVASDESIPRLWRSRDGGHRFELLTTLPRGQVRTLRLAMDADGLVAQVYAIHNSHGLTSDLGPPQTSLLSWADGTGVRMSGLQMGDDLLHAQAEPPGLLLRRDAPDGPGFALAVGSDEQGGFDDLGWVRFFGGFALAPDGAMFVGDEGGGIQRAATIDQDFAPYAGTAVTCLTHHVGLWACTPGLPHRPALVRFVERPTGQGEGTDGSGDPVSAEPVLALSDVEALISCRAELAVESVCAAAWREWRADVLGADVGLSAPPPSETAPPADTPEQGNGVSTGLGPDGNPSNRTVLAETPEPAVDTDGDTDADAGMPMPGVMGGACRLPQQPAPPARIPAAMALFIVALLWCRRAPAKRLRAQTFWSSVAPMSPTPPGAHVPSNDDDVALIERAQTGDVEAFAALYDRHAPVLMALCLRMGVTESEAADLLQDVFIEAWQAVRSYDPARAKVRTWLVVRTRSRALDRLRRRRSQRLAHAELKRNHAAQPGPAVPTTERSLAVRAALASLDRDVRHTLELTYFAGLTAAEVGAKMDVPEGTVRSRLARGMKALGQLLGEDPAPAKRSDA